MRSCETMQLWQTHYRKQFGFKVGDKIMLKHVEIVNRRERPIEEEVEFLNDSITPGNVKKIGRAEIIAGRRVMYYFKRTGDSMIYEIDPSDLKRREEKKYSANRINKPEKVTQQ